MKNILACPAQPRQRSAGTAAAPAFVVTQAGADDRDAANMGAEFIKADLAPAKPVPCKVVAKRSPIGMKLLLMSGANVAEASKCENNGRIVADVTKAPLRRRRQLVRARRFA